MDKKELKELLSQFTREEILDIVSEVEDKKPNRKRRRGKGSRKNRQSKPGFKNKFDEMMNNISLTNDEIKELKLAEQSDTASEQNPFRGRRQKASKVKVVCVSCNREYEMYPSQIHNRERWTCNRCLSGRHG
jgi:hypothetical protein|tara:strand:+ start:1688 stop:2083 length:396 start_codon:yes stop_codon:yes gene_type:complete